MPLRPFIRNRGRLGNIRTLVLLLKELNISSNAAAGLTTVARACLAGRGAHAREVGGCRRPGESPEDRGAAEESFIGLLIGVRIVLVLHALV